MCLCCQGQTKVIKLGSAQDSNELTNANCPVRAYIAMLPMPHDLGDTQGLPAKQIIDV